MWSRILTFISVVLHHRCFFKFYCLFDFGLSVCFCHGCLIIFFLRDSYVGFVRLGGFLVSGLFLFLLTFWIRLKLCDKLTYKKLRDKSVSLSSSTAQVIIIIIIKKRQIILILKCFCF